ncbi:MAG: PilN domain-containing protein [Pseudomonadota bacterium]
MATKPANASALKLARTTWTADIQRDVRAAVAVFVETVSGEARDVLTVSDLKKARDGAGRRATIVLPEKLSLRQKLALPRAAARHLPAIVENKIREMTPFEPEDVYFAFRVLERSGDDITVEIAVAPKRFAEPCLSAARRIGYAVDRIEAAGAPGLNVFAAAEVGFGARAAKNGRLLKINAALLVLFASLALGGGGARLVAAKMDAARAERGAAEVLQARRDVQRLVRASSDLDVLMRTAPDAAVLMNALAQAVPDGAWLDRVDVDPSTVKVQGYADNASAVLVAIERLDGLKDATFRSTVSRDAASGKERFSVQATIEATP